MQGNTFILFIVMVLFGPALLAQSPVAIPDSIKKNISTEIAFIRNEIGREENTRKRVLLTCYLSKLYNRVTRYQEAKDLLDSLTQAEFSAAPGEVCLARAVNFKFLIEPEKAKFLFDRVLLFFTIRKNNCMLIETRVELMEYYRKFDLPDLAYGESEATNLLFKQKAICDPLLYIRYLNRKASVQNMSNLHDACIRTSKECIDSCLKYNELYYLAVSYNEIGFAYQHSSGLDSAGYFYKRSEDLFISQDLIADALHTKMNRLRMYAHNRINIPELIPGLLELEQEAENSNTGYDLMECYKSIWVESETVGNWEMAFRYYKKFYETERQWIYKYNDERIEKIKQQEKESQTKIQNYILSTRVEKQKGEIRQSRNTIWLIVFALIVLIAIMLFLFRILKQRNKLTKDLEQRNQQKDQLIQEVHHRVKNNLSFVSSLLEMQINSLPEETKTEELKNASLRIESMSLVHQMLYNQDNIATVDLKSYIPELLAGLKDSMVHSHGVSVDLNCEEIKVESRTATAFGLIITEFVTNSFKHAFKGIKNPEIVISLTSKNGNLHLLLKDNGIGMNSEIKSAKKGFGMRIIDIFSRQINASVNFSFDHGTQLTVVMQYEE